MADELGWDEDVMEPDIDNISNSEREERNARERMRRKWKVAKSDYSNTLDTTKTNSQDLLLLQRIRPIWYTINNFLY